MKVSLAIVASLAVACAFVASPACAPSPIGYNVMDGFSEQQWQLMGEAAAFWNEHTNEPLYIGQGKWKIVTGTLTDPYAGYAGLTESSKKTITIDLAHTGSDPVFFRAIIMHEMGHSMGFEHIAGEGIMNKWITSTEITAADLHECRKHHRCN